MDYNNIHIHSHYSTLDGIPTPEEYCKKAVELGQDAVAITDHGSIAGWYELWKAAKKHNIKPIAGCEFYLVDNIHVRIMGEFKGHICLYGRTKQGIENIKKLHNMSQMLGFYNKPRIDFAMLRAHSKGIIATSACLGGHAAAFIMGNERVNEQHLKSLCRIFGKNFLLEIQPGNTPEQIKVNEALIERARLYDYHLIASTDAHYLSLKDCDLHDTYICINTKQSKAKEDRFKFNTDNNCFMSSDEVMRAFGKITNRKYKPDVITAIENTKRLTDKCIALDFKPVSVYDALPSFCGDPLEEERMFIDLCKAGMKKKGLWEKEEYLARVKSEHKIIKEFGFINYFLIVRDIINAAKENGILVGHGRGSAAGSLCCYLLGITHIDPIKYNLLFERFLSPDRKGELPDIDIDFEDRDWAVQYAKEKYGDKHVMCICTFSRLGVKNTIKDVGRVYDLDFAFLNWLTKEIGDDETIEMIRKRKILLKSPVILDYSEQLAGRIRHVGTHASGVIISSKPISDLLPVIRVKGQNGQDLIALEMDAVAELGFTKFDFLGLNTLKVLNSSLKQIEISLDDIPLDDGEVFRHFWQKNTAGIFQFESKCATNLINKIKPKDIEDIAVATALNRPGPLNSGMHELYIKNKNKPSGITYLHPLLEKVLGVTYGVIVYQEQVMQIARVLAGFTAKESNKLRKAVSKKKEDVMASIKNNFIDGCEKNDVDAEVAKTLWGQIEKFAEYGFNKSHSVSYAILAYQAMWVKYYYPGYFYAALLNIKESKDQPYIAKQAQKEGISVKVCNINKSGNHWKGSKETIYEGFAGIKGMGKNDGIFIEQNQPYDNFDDFYNKTLGSVKPGKIKLLIDSYAFISIDERRKEELLEDLEIYEKERKRKGKRERKTN